MTTMRAAVRRNYGPPSVVTIEEVDRPSPGENDVLVRITTTSVNRTDCAYRSASPFVMRFITGLRKPRRFVIGTEFAGEVVETGAGVSRFSVGQRVFGYNEGHAGVHAEYVVVPEHGALAVTGEGISETTAAASTEGAHYALVSIRKAGLGAGQDALIYGASGAIGSAAVQLAKELGANVTAVCGTDQVETIRQLGPDRVVDYQTSDFTTDAQRYDLVFDAVGKTSYKACKPLLKPGGVYAWSEAGPWAKNFFLVAATRWFGPHRVIFAYPSFDQEMIEYLGGIVSSGAFTPLLDRSFPLDEIVSAYEYVETGQKVGNVTITV